MEKRKQFEQIHFFRSCTKEQYDMISPLFVERTFEKGTYLFFEQEPCTLVYFLIEGLVKVFRTEESGREQIVNLFVSNDMFPHVGVTKEGAYPATAQAQLPSVVWVMRVDDFQSVCQQIPSLQMRLAELMDQHIRELQQRLVTSLDKDIPTRIYEVIWPIACRIGKKVQGGYIISPALTHQEIADLVGISRETVTRAIPTLKKEKRMDVRNHQLYLFYPPANGNKTPALKR